MSTFPTRIAAADAGRLPRSAGRPASGWASRLIVFAVYPRFARRQHDRRLPAWALTVAATAFALYGLWVTIQPSAT